jgi:hypothetical protein
MGRAQRRNNRVIRHREHLLAAIKQQLENELSCPARGASPVTVPGGDAVSELDNPASLVGQDTPDSPVDQDACGHGRKRRRHVSVQDYPWKFVSPQLLDCNGQEIFFRVEDDRDRWWAQQMEWAIDQHRDLAEHDMDSLQAFSTDLVRRVQLLMRKKNAKEKCCFCLARQEHERNQAQA